MSPEELHLIDRSIEAYKNTIKFLRTQILDLERKKLVNPSLNCPQCFKIVNKKGKSHGNSK